MSIVNGSANLILEKADGTIINYGMLGSGTTTGIFAETVDLDMGEPRAKKQLQRILLWINSIAAISGVSLVVKYRNGVHEPLVEHATYSLQNTSEPLKVRVPNARFIRLRIEDEGSNVNWALFGFECWGVVAGRRW